MCRRVIGVDVLVKQQRRHVKPTLPNRCSMSGAALRAEAAGAPPPRTAPILRTPAPPGASQSAAVCRRNVDEGDARAGLEELLESWVVRNEHVLFVLPPSRLVVQSSASARRAGIHSGSLPGFPPANPSRSRSNVVDLAGKVSDLFDRRSDAARLRRVCTHSSTVRWRRTSSFSQKNSSRSRHGPFRPDGSEAAHARRDVQQQFARVASFSDPGGRRSACSRTPQLSPVVLLELLSRYLYRRLISCLSTFASFRIWSRRS